MKHFLLLFAAAAFSVSLLGIAQSERTPPESPALAARPQASPIKATDLLEMEVHNTQEHLGEIEDMMVNFRSARILYAVLGTGGILGIGDKLIALPPTALSPAGDGKRLLLQADKVSLQAAPGFQQNNWPEMADTTWLNERDRHYAKHEERIEEASGAERTNAPSRKDPQATAELTPPRNMRMSGLIGLAIRDDHNEPIGEIQDAAIDLQTGELRYLVVTTGKENQFLAVAPQILRQSKTAKHLVAALSHPAIQAATHFDRDHWPNENKKILGSIDEPAGTAAGARSDGRTALDQSNAKRDLMITQQLRRSIMKDPRMSTMTRNITIITADGVITVRGTVASQTEADRIVAFAREIAGNEVVNELKIRNTERKAQ